ncbi:CBS domain-containing protein [Polaromonas sp. CG_23.6]|uniref:CBS domain-containing protein n=1 Tax=Polaromonas sp. CG_23.6 TaxID=2760709 RepID=UPI002473627F|nr:CBS domain-containing protein [Polaromonas sp. CG_23.6]MDH6186797.1 CBS domain-containing protein [Polaromonas sp. CG_23.6]
MNTKLVSSIEAVARSRLVTVPVDALLVNVATLLSNTHISLVVVCEADGRMAGVITKTNVVRCLGHCAGSACAMTAVNVMTRDVAFCHPADGLADVLAMMQARGFVHVPVVDQHAIPSGVINARDALRELLTQEQYEESLLRDYVMGIGYQ